MNLKAVNDISSGFDQKNIYINAHFTLLIFKLSAREKNVFTEYYSESERERGRKKWRKKAFIRRGFKLLIQTSPITSLLLLWLQLRGKMSDGHGHKFIQHQHHQSLIIIIIFHDGINASNSSTQTTTLSNECFTSFRERFL